MSPQGFPRFTLNDPAVPVWCLTDDTPGCIHRFFDTSPLSTSGRYLAVFQLPREDRAPQPGEPGWVRLIDLETGSNRVVAETCGWEPQLGANVNWGATDHELFFNDVEPDTWPPFAWKLNPLTGDRVRLGATVYHASPDGRHLISANLSRSRFTQPGYSVVLPPESVQRSLGASKDDGFMLTDTQSGKSRLLLSLYDIFSGPNAVVSWPGIDSCEVYGFHAKFNPQGDRLMLSVRWFEPKGKPVFDVFARHDIQIHFAWVTCDIDGTNLHCAAGPEQWAHGGHHATWFPDGKRLSMNLQFEGGPLRFVQVDADGRNLHSICKDVLGSGHPSIAPDGRHLITDSYVWESMAFEDGSVPLRWVDLETETEECLMRIPSRTPVEDPVMRLDPHPAWDRTGRYVVFNGFVDGTRRVFLADLASRMV